MKSKRDQSKTMLSLPLEILNNILSRLPAKCLGRCKCVCKPYNSLISDEEFVKLHLNRAKSDTTQSRVFMVCPFYSLDFESEYAFEDGDNDDENEALTELGFAPDQLPEVDPNVEGSVEFVGSCNGLICLCYTPGNYILWNPTIKESREIPDPTASFVDLKFFGLGYNPSGDNYKLVTCVFQKDTKTSVIEVFSVKIGSWTRIEHELGDVIVDTPVVGTYLNGALHWEVTRGVEPHKRKSFILLNLGGEKYEFGEILGPNVADENVVFCNLGIIDGCISLFSEEKCDKLSIWVMKEYGVRESWSRIALLNLLDFSFCCYAMPLCFAKNGEIVIDIDGEILVRYNMKDRSSRSLKNGEGPHLMYALYVESLISPTRI